MHLSSLSVVFIICLLFISCEHEVESTSKPLVNAVITLTSPVENAVYRNGDTVRIQGIAIADGILHGYQVIVRRLNDTSHYYLQHYHDHNDTLLVSDEWINTLNAPFLLEAEVRVGLDDFGNTQNKKIRFGTQ